MFSIVLAAPLAFASADTLPVPVARLTTPFGEEGFSQTLAIDGDWIATTGRGSDDVVFLYRRNPLDANDWFLAQGIDLGAGTYSLALHGNTLAVGLRSLESVQMYELEDGRWNLAQVLTSSTYHFGEHVRLEGDTLAVSAGFRICYLGAFDESVHVFERTPGAPASWSLQVVLEPAASGGLRTSFGEVVALRGDALTISEPVLSFLCETRKPAHVYRRDLGGPSNWGEEAQLLPPPSGTGSFGEFLEQSGNLAFIGEPTGVTIYDRNGAGANSWVATATIEIAGREMVFEGERLYAKSGSNQISVFERHLGGENAWGLVGVLPLPSSAPQILGTPIVRNRSSARLELAMWANQSNANPDQTIYVYATPTEPPVRRLQTGPIRR